MGGEIVDPWASQRVTAALLDTSVLIAADRPPVDEAAISVVSLTELHFGVLVAADDDTQALRVRRLGIVEDRFDTLPFEGQHDHPGGDARRPHAGGAPWGMRRRCWSGLA